jgi:hypothetical protein
MQAHVIHTKKMASPAGDAIYRKATGRARTNSSCNARDQCEKITTSMPLNRAGFTPS